MKEIKMAGTSNKIIIFLLILTIHLSNGQLFTMDKSKIYKIYSDILPKKDPRIIFDNGTVAATTEKLHVKHYSNSKINTYLANIHQQDWFESNRVPQDSEKATEDYPTENNNEWFNNINKRQSDWTRHNRNTENDNNNNNNNERPKRVKYSNIRFDQDSNNNNKNNKRYVESEEWNTNNNENSNGVNSNRHKNTKDWSKRANYVTAPDYDQQQHQQQQYSTIKYKQHKTKHETSNDNKNIKSYFDDWSTPRSMSDFSEWLTTPQPTYQYTPAPSPSPSSYHPTPSTYHPTPSSETYPNWISTSERNQMHDWSSQAPVIDSSNWIPNTENSWNPKPNNNYYQNNWQSNADKNENNWNENVIITTQRPEPEKLSTIAPIIDVEITSDNTNNQNNNYNKRHSLYSGTNSYGGYNTDNFNIPPHIANNNNNYRQNNNNRNILNNQFDIPENVHSFDPYSEYQDFVSIPSSTSSYYPTDSYISSTTLRPTQFSGNYETSFRPNLLNSNYNNNNNNYNNQNNNNNFNNNNYNAKLNYYQNKYNNLKNRQNQNFGEPEPIIENRFQNQLKKHFDNTINLYENTQHYNNKRPSTNIDVDLPVSKVKFQIGSSDKAPKITISNYHITSEHTPTGVGEVYSSTKGSVTAPSGPSGPSGPSYNDYNYNMDSVPQNSNHGSEFPDISFTTPSSPVIEIGKKDLKGSPSSYYDGNYTLHPPPTISYEIPHLKRSEKKKPHINWCRLKSKRYITDKRCVSLDPIIESVCSDNCVMPPINTKKRKHGPKWRNSPNTPWTCVDSDIQWKKIKLRCQDKSIRWYNLKVVNGCNCRKKPLKVTKRIRTVIS